MRSNIAARFVAGALCLLGTALFGVAIPVFYVRLRDECFGADALCQAFYDKPPTLEWMTVHGFAPAVFAGAYTALYGMFGLMFIGAGLLILRKASFDFAGQVTAVALTLTGLTFESLTRGLRGIYSALDGLVSFVEAVGFVSLIALFFVFPNGRFAPRWTKWLLLSILVPGGLKTAFPESGFDLQQWSEPVFIVWVLLWMGAVIGVLVYRYRRVLGPLEKQQTKWAVFGMSAAIFTLFVITTVYVILGDRIAERPLLLFGLEIVLALGMMMIPVTLSFALLKRKLWDIDPIVNRTLVYGGLSFAVVAVYVVAVWYVGDALKTSAEWRWLYSAAATGVVAVLFAPLKERLQRKVNRLMYGHNDDPLTVLGQLGSRLEHPLSPRDALEVTVRTVREALKLPYAGIELNLDGETALVAENAARGVKVTGQSGGVSAGTETDEWGDDVRVDESYRWRTAQGGFSASDDVVRFPLVHRGEPIGALVVGTRSPGEAFNASDRRLLEMMVRQAGPVVQSAKASIDLERAAEDLRVSRERLVLAREEERRRLRRNLHDDLAPRLAALAYTASAAESLMDSDPGKTKTILVELQTVIRTAVSDIRRLVHDLRPPALDELGLVGAIEERIADLSRPLMARAVPQSSDHPPSMPQTAQKLAREENPSSLRFFLHAPATLPSLPAAVEVAAFRIVTEALVNVVRHASAATCHVKIAYPAPSGGNGLVIEVVDDGRGIGGSGGVHADGAGNGRQSTMGPGDPGGIGRPSAMGPGGIGMQSMRERAEELGGRLTFSRLSPSGTRLHVYLPVAAEDEMGSSSSLAP